MVRFLSKILIMAMVPFLLAFSLGDNKPKKNDLKNALAQKIPSFIKVTSFTIEALQNYGNEVEPEYRSRFKATVEASDNLYRLENKENEIIFVRLNTLKGGKTDIFGKTRSILYQGSWQHDISIDGNPIGGLGTPINQISGGRVIVRGSNEEKNYYTEVERKKAELRNNIANAKKILVGAWRDDNSLSTFNSDGTGTLKHDNGEEDVIDWEVDGDILIVKIIKYRRNGNKWATGKSIHRYKIVSINESTIILKALNNSDTYTMTRIK